MLFRSASGEATVSIEPNIVTTLADNESVVMNQPSLTVYLANDDILYSTDASGMFQIQFDVREVIT